MTEPIREFSAEVTGEVLQNDFENYKQLAMELGATEAKIISTDLVIVDERVLARCISPMCPYYMTNLNCPPHTLKPEETVRLVSRYDSAIFMMLRVPPEEHANKDYDDSKSHRIPGAIKMYKIVAKVQSAAFYDGYHLATGFSGGPCCKRAFCPDKECSGLKGEGCRFAYKVNPTMHSVGMDAFTMASRVGWSIYPIGKDTVPDQVPFGIEMGLVLIH